MEISDNNPTELPQDSNKKQKTKEDRKDNPASEQENDEICNIEMLEKDKYNESKQSSLKIDNHMNYATVDGREPATQQMNLLDDKISFSKFRNVVNSQEIENLDMEGEENDNLETEDEGDQAAAEKSNTDNENTKETKQKYYYFSILKGNYPENVKNAILLRKNWKELDEKKDMFEHSQFIWKPINFSIKDYGKIDLYLRRGSKLVVNHLQKINGICTKTGLIESLRTYYDRNIEAAKIGYNIFDSTPTTYLLTPLLEGSEFKSFNYSVKSSRSKLEKDKPDYIDLNIPAKHCQNGTWLVKPSSMNRGRGIEIFHNKDDIIKFLSSKPLFSKWVVQKYIERPLLYKQRKFDLRVWAVFSYTNEVYFYKKGYVRLSSENYSLDDKNNYVHLTNNCLQQLGDKYGAHEDGNTIGYEALQQFLDETYPDK